jgi:hypothetical protein
MNVDGLVLEEGKKSVEWMVWVGCGLLEEMVAFSVCGREVWRGIVPEGWCYRVIDRGRRKSGSAKN